MAGGTPAPLHALPWALLRDLGTARVRARKSAFPNNPTPSTPQAQVHVEVILQNGLLSAAQPFSKSRERVAFCVITQRETCILQ